MLPRSCADCLEILGVSSYRSPRDLSRSVQVQLNVTVVVVAHNILVI